MSPAKRIVLRWTRTLHIYLTLLALLLLLFFAVTGFMLNHADWFSLEEVQTRTKEGHLPTAVLSDPPDKLAVVERLRADFGVAGLVDSFEIEEDELRVVFTGPGQRTEATIERAEGLTKVVSESHGLMAPSDRPAPRQGERPGVEPDHRRLQRAAAVRRLYGVGPVAHAAATPSIGTGRSDSQCGGVCGCLPVAGAVKPQHPPIRFGDLRCYLSGTGRFHLKVAP